jgi:hypothetical protein
MAPLYEKASFMIKAIVSTAALLTLLAGCTPQANQKRFSTDVDALKKLITLPFPYKNARWELFATPEDDGGIPGPTDYITLVAEIGPRNDQQFNSLPRAQPFHALPNAARSWMNAASRRLLNSVDGTNAELSHHPDCRMVAGLIKRSFRAFTGHLCTSEDRLLPYMVVVDGFVAQIGRQRPRRSTDKLTA